MSIATHPLWLVGFRPFFTLACLAGLSLPLAWALIFIGAVSPAPTFAFAALQWHAHEMLFGFGLAMLGGFLLTASKNWLAIRGYHGWPLVLLAASWLLDRALMLFGGFGGGLPKPMLLILGSLFTTALVAMLLASLIRHRKTDSYADNGYFIVALPFLLPAKWLLLSDGHFGDGIAMSIAVFRLAFLIMLERTLVQFMANAMKITLPRHRWLDHGIKGLALLLIAAPFLPTGVAGSFTGLLCLLMAVRWLLWRPLAALQRLDIGIMALGHLAIVAHAGLDAAVRTGFSELASVATVHIFTLGAMGLIIPAMIVRIARGHTGRPVRFESADKAVLWLMIAAMVARVFVPPLLPAQYSIWILISACLWLLAFGTLAWRYLPWLIAPRADGREH